MSGRQDWTEANQARLIAGLAELRLLLERHASVGSRLAEALLADPRLADDTWLVEPVAGAPATVGVVPSAVAARRNGSAVVKPTGNEVRSSLER
jgi:hypothetical protein